MRRTPRDSREALKADCRAIVRRGEKAEDDLEGFILKGSPEEKILKAQIISDCSVLVGKVNEAMGRELISMALEQVKSLEKGSKLPLNRL